MSLARQLRLYHRLQLTARTLERIADAALAEAAQLSTAQAAVLALLQRENDDDGAPGQTQRAIARRLGLAESAVTTMVTRLLAAGLVQRKPHVADSRAWSLSLTEAGRARMQRAGSAFAAANGALEEALAPDELRQLADWLDRIATRFGEPPASA